MSPFIASHNSLLGSKAAVKRAGLVQTSLGSPWQPALQEPFLPFPSFLFCCCCCCVIKTSRIESPPGCSAGPSPDLLPASSQLPSPFLIPRTSKVQPQTSKAQSKLSPSSVKPSPASHQDIFPIPTLYFSFFQFSPTSSECSDKTGDSPVPSGRAVSGGAWGSPAPAPPICSPRAEQGPSCTECSGTEGAAGDLQSPHLGQPVLGKHSNARSSTSHPL